MSPASVQFSRWGGGAVPGAQVVQLENAAQPPGPLTYTMQTFTVQVYSTSARS